MGLHTVSSFVAAGAAVALGLFAIILDRRSAVWYLLLLGMLLLAAESFFAGMSAWALLPVQMLAWQRARLFVTALLPATWLVFSLTYARGNRLETLQRWSLLLVVFTGIPIAAATVGYPELVTLCVPPGPEQTEWLARLGSAGKTLYVMLLLTGVLVLMNLERTVRTAVGTMRWRVKFMVLGVGIIFAVRIHTSAQALLYSGVCPASSILHSAALLLGGLLMARGLLRNRSSRVDLYVSHAVLYRSAAVLLSGLYLLFVGALAGLFRKLGGIADFPLLTLVVFVGILGLGVLLSSDRVRLYTKRFVSVHFHRPQYDYRRVWMSFADATAGLMEREAYCRSVVRVVSETFEALSVTIWLTGPGRDRLIFGASTSLSAGNTAGEFESSVSVEATLRGLRDARAPVDLDALKEEWAVPLRERNPASFPEKGGHRIALPLVGQDALTGVMVVGDRVVGVPFSAEELDLLGVIAGQVGAGLLNIDLSERLLQSREIEAFQTMSAFFVHDLKNTASTLSLMLENLPKHFDNPSFRADALKSIGKSVGRIEHLIRRLTLLRRKLDIHPVKTELNALVESTIGGLAGAVNPHPTMDLERVPTLMLDPEQIEKVLTNLVLNACEATGQQGEVVVSTRMDGDAVVLAVVDNGCGMSRRFMEESLFRPFQSTKKEGMGIGLFQSKMIVEAHGGKIQVESEEAHGATFRVWFPVEGESD